MSKKTSSYIKSEPRVKNRKSVPILTPGIGTRISAAAEQIGTRKSAAGAAGVSSDSLQRYIREEVEPTFSAVAGLAHAAGVNLEWLATGEGPMLRGEAEHVAPLDQGVMRDVIQVVEEFLQERGLRLEPEKKAELLVLLYEDVREHEGKVDRARILKLVNLAA